MAGAESITAESGRFSLGLARSQRISVAVMATFVISIAGSIAADDSSPSRSSLVNAVFDQLVFGGEGVKSITAARHRLEALLQDKIALIEGTSGLDETQRRRIELAGRGDIKRYFD